MLRDRFPESSSPGSVREAGNAGIDLPLAQSVYEYLRGAELITVEANRPSPSFWHEPAAVGPRREDGIERLTASPVCLPRMPLAESMKIFADLGFTRIEAFTSDAAMSVAYTDKPERYRRLSDDLCLLYGSIHLPAVARGDSAGVVAAQRCLGFAAALRCPIALLKAETIDAFPEAVDAPRLKVLFEVGHYERVGVPWQDALATLTQGSPSGFESIAYCHIKDFDEAGNSVALGTGRIDFPALFERLHQGGYTGRYVVEIEGGADRPPEDVIRDLRVSIDNLVPILR